MAFSCLSSSFASEPPPDFRQGGLPIEDSRWIAKAKVGAVRYWSTRDWAKIVVSTSRTVPYLYGPHPASAGAVEQSRFYVDLIDSVSSVAVEPSLHEAGGLIASLSLSQNNSRISRLEIQLTRQASLKIVSYEVSDSHVVTVELSRISEAEDPAPPSAAEDSSPASERIDRVVIDPGHGGRDPGSTGFGVAEKEIVLRIAQKIQTLFVKQTNVQALLTRTSDESLSLEERGVIARRFQGDLFVSLHLNANPQPQVQGVESYFLDTTTDAQSLQLATRENEMTGGALTRFTAILRDLVRVTHSSDSNRLAYSVHTQLLQSIGSRYQVLPIDLGVKEAPFLVLLQAEMPAVLIEISFITNPEENRRLQEDRYLGAVAEGIFNGIQKYLLEGK